MGFKLNDLGGTELPFGYGCSGRRKLSTLGSEEIYKNLLLKVGLSKAYPLPTPMLGNFLSKIVNSQQSSPPADVSIYRSTIRALQHVCITKPDIHFVVNKLSQYMQQPSIWH